LRRLPNLELNIWKWFKRWVGFDGKLSGKVF